MKPILIFATHLLFAAAAIAQEATPDFEAPPVLHADEILKPEILAGPDHRVLENVSTFHGRNSYTIETRWDSNACRAVRTHISCAARGETP